MCECVRDLRSPQRRAFILEPLESSRRRGGRGADLDPHSSQVIPESPELWQSESLLAESWSTVGDPEDAKSLEAGDLPGLSTHGNDMVHVEMLEVGARAEEEQEQMQSSVLSVLGTEKDLQAIRQEEHLEAQREKQREEFRQVLPPMALPPLPVVLLDPPSTTSTPDPSTSSEVEDLHPPSGLQPPSILSAKAQVETVPEPRFSQAPSQPRSELPALLCGGALLVAVVGVVTAAALAYCRK